MIFMGQCTCENTICADIKICLCPEDACRCWKCYFIRRNRATRRFKDCFPGVNFRCVYSQRSVPVQPVSQLSQPVSQSSQSVSTVSETGKAGLTEMSMNGDLPASSKLNPDATASKSEETEIVLISSSSISRKRSTSAPSTLHFLQPLKVTRSYIEKDVAEIYPIRLERSLNDLRTSVSRSLVDTLFAELLTGTSGPNDNLPSISPSQGKTAVRNTYGNFMSRQRILTKKSREAKISESNTSEIPVIEPQPESSISHKRDNIPKK